MTLDFAYFVLLLTGLGLMLAQVFIKQKRLEHIFFAIFCGSLAMVALKHLTADILGPYQYIIGLGTSATCNAMWLVARAMFRGEGAIQTRHILFAILVAMLVMFNQGIHLAAELSWLTSNAFSYLNNSLSEFTQLMSSTVLVMTFWEAIRPQSNQSLQTHWQRYIFAGSFATGLLLCTVGISAFVEVSQRNEVFPWLVVFSALQIMLVTQAVQYWQAITRQPPLLSPQARPKLAQTPTIDVDESVIAGINRLLDDEKQFLQHNLKMIDLANSLSVSEYKISRAIRYHFKARNFNHFVNQYRIEHAKSLLEHPPNQHWSMLVIGLESGFSSVTSFNRAFKSMIGCSPSEYRTTETQTI